MLKMLSNLFGGGVESIDIDTYLAEYKPNKNHVLIDVRTPKEFKAERVANAKNIPLNTINKNMNKIPKDRPVVLMCRTGNRSGMAARQLMNAGYENIVNLKGGILRWKAQGNPVK
ncbi:MAG: rhodanese-like domain-containing protein [Chloroflexota bacterium]